MLLTSQWRSSTAVIAVDVSQSRVARVTPEDGGSWSLLCVSAGWPPLALYRRSAF